jgi:DNA mismatch repair ATPase MutS
MAMEKDETYLFKIKPGLVRKGYGIECAKKFMDSDFIKRA